MNTFLECVEFVLDAEGGYVYDKRDPGGETKFGISKRQYPEKDIRGLTKADAVLIYRVDYWEAIRAEEMPAKLRLPYFDCAVNQGYSAAVLILQRILRVKMDGIVGPVTVGVANRAEPRTLVMDYMTERALRYSRTRGLDIYGKGWFRRLFSVALS